MTSCMILPLFSQYAIEVLQHFWFVRTVMTLHWLYSEAFFFLTIYVSCLYLYEESSIC